MRLSVVRMRPFTTTNWLRDQLLSSNIHRNSALRVLDASCDRSPEVDGYKEYFLQSHIPQSSYFSLHYLCPRAPSSLEKFPVPDINRFQDYVEGLGVSNDTHVVAYDRFDTVFALKTWWLFRLFGHENVSVLDGGFIKWLRDCFEVSAEEPTVKRGSFKPTFTPALLHTFEDMEENLKTQEKQVVDTRPASWFYNDKEKMPEGLVGGHMRGAKNIPYTALFQADGTLKPADELEDLLDRHGICLESPLVATCQLALTANGLAAVAYMLGHEQVPVYNGSFLEWGQRAKPDQIVD